jgi:hypothetical protein
MHGAKRHYQVLIDPARADLLDRVAVKEGKRTTALIRDLLHEFLQGVYTNAEYQEALDADQTTRADAVRRQTDGRIRARKTEST